MEHFEQHTDPHSFDHLPQLAQLPVGPVSFTGRRDALAVLDGLLADRLDRGARLGTVVIAGPPGVGKTALALQWAYLVRDRFVNGVLYSDLGGFGGEGEASPATVLEGFLLALGVPGNAIPSGLSERAAVYRDLLTSRRLLVVLDNAASARQVRPLLAGSAGSSMVVVTSRPSLTGLEVREGARTLALRELTVEEAVELVLTAAADHRVPLDPALAARLVRSCGCLPLALAIVIHRLARCANAAALVQRMEDNVALLDLLSVSGDDSLSVRDLFLSSYQRLPEPQARALRMIGTYAPHGIGVPEAANLLQVMPAVAMELLEDLAGANLLRSAGDGVYGCPALVATFAAELAEQQNLAC